MRYNPSGWQRVALRMELPATIQGRLSRMEQLSDQWETNLFGLLRVRCGRQSIDHFQTRQTALLFAYLVIHPRRYPRDELVELLWPDADPELGRPRLSQAIWHIRQTLQQLNPSSGREILITDRSTVAINSAQMESDVARFRQLLQHAAKQDSVARAEPLAEAVLLYGDSGGFLVGFYDDWVLAERQKLLTDYLTALETLTQHFEKAGEWQRALAFAEKAIAADPLREDLHHNLIRLLVTSGQTAVAQRHYDNLARLLARELNTAPSEATRALIATVTPAPSSPGSIPALSLRVAPLPVLLTTFYGREAFLRDINALLNEPATRLITLLGTGGIGKTRLALEIARDVAARSSEPMVAFVPLADIVEPRLITETIADTLTPRSAAPPLQRITDALTAPSDTSPFLLILDNAEHLIEPVGATIKTLLAHVPRLRILVTSQRSLGISGEREVPLTPLEYAGHTMQEFPAILSTTERNQTPSVELFLDRAKSVRPGFPMDAATIADVVHICERLEGLPLAIELCAGWAQTLGTQQMREMLARRFELLVSRRTDIPARHRTLRAAIEYSYIQLSKSMQEFFVSLSIFRDGWTLAAAAAVCTNDSVPTALAMLAQMRERSLIVADEVRLRDGMRYKMLESLRDFAIEQQTTVQAQQRGEAHATYFARFVEETVARMQGPEEALWAARFEDETANIRAALDYLISRREIEDARAIQTIWAFVATVAKTWNGRGHAREAVEWVTRALTLTPMDTNPDAMDEPREDLQHLRARLLMIRAESLRILSDYAAAAASAGQALVIWRERNDSTGMAECLELMGLTALFNDDYDLAQDCLTQALVLARTLGDPYRIAQVLSGLGGVALAQQDWQTAHDLITECLAVGRQLDNNRSVCSYLNNLSLVARYQGHYAEARTLLHEAIALRDRHGLTNYSAFDLNLAVVERLDGCYQKSLHLLSLAIQNTLAYGERRVLAWCVKEMGHLAITLHRYALGLRLLSCAETMRQSIGASFKPIGPQEIAHDRAIAEQTLGKTEATEIWIAGASAEPEALLDQAQAELSRLLESEETKKSIPDVF